jgi:hypothetical protein
MVHTTPTKVLLTTTLRPLVMQLSGSLAQGVRLLDQYRNEEPTPQKMATFEGALSALLREVGRRIMAWVLNHVEPEHTEEAPARVQFEGRVSRGARGHRLENPSLILFAESLLDAIVLGHQAHQACGLMNIEIVDHKVPPGRLVIRGHGASNVCHKVLFGACRPSDGATTVPCATSKLAINVNVPRRIYSNSRRSSWPGSMSLVGCLRSSAWIPVISSVDSTCSPASNKVGACAYSVVRSAIFSLARASGSALSQ